MSNTKRPPFEGGNGYITLKLGASAAWHKVVIHGGPFDGWNKDSAVGICVRAEQQPSGAAAYVTIPDFGVPYNTASVDRALITAFKAAIEGLPVYVGCMGGWGRTGLFLSLMAKVAGEPYPVGFVRKNYSPRAVETAEQARYVTNFDVRAVRRAINRIGWRARVGL